MNTVVLEARLMGLVHRPGCAGDRVETFDAARPGPLIRGSGRGPSRPGPAVPLRVARCIDCSASAVRVIELRERLEAIAAVIDAKEAQL
ncbi:MAG: hypothetical protein H0U37_07985 [Chloroflexi bacterium]|nr:hypothetical protein [Chloroflexota bacterium]